MRQVEVYRHLDGATGGTAARWDELLARSPPVGRAVIYGLGFTAAIGTVLYLAAFL